MSNTAARSRPSKLVDFRLNQDEAQLIEWALRFARQNIDKALQAFSGLEQAEDLADAASGLGVLGERLSQARHAARNTLTAVRLPTCPECGQPVKK